MGATLTSDGVEIAYSVWGRRDGTPVLLIQGLGVDHRGWGLQRGAFGRAHRCIALDNRGTGHSDAPAGPYDLGRMAEDAHWISDVVGSALLGVGTTELFLHLHALHDADPSRYRIFPVPVRGGVGLGVSIAF